MLDEINIRFRKLRKLCKKSQEEWGKIIGITKSGVSEIESGRRKVTEQHIIMLRNWAEYNVNIDWLRTGNGDPFIEMDRDDELAAWAGSILSPGNDNEFTKRFVHMLSKLKVEDWKVLEKMALLMTEENKNG